LQTNQSILIILKEKRIIYRYRVENDYTCGLCILNRNNLNKLSKIEQNINYNGIKDLLDEFFKKKALACS